ncbi:uncharacterized protein LOC101741041 [Bombyx mori]|uniref:Uncharacterized protein n=1 Tax=Bombyx mori TaxID=7091 RepID=A0A8R2M8L4_BOMMO|nr:uncharacterized protein LOC101741041 isoform X2 [Bombyx mori]
MDSKLVIIIVLGSYSYGFQYDGLRVKFGWSDALADIEYFYSIPRTIKDAENDGWRRTEPPPGPILELRMYCPPGRVVCPLYDTSGFVAGLQIAIPVDEFESSVIKPEKKFVKWYAAPAEGEPSRDYWTATQYYVSEESLKAGAGPQIENGATLQDGGVWVAGPDAHLLRIPTTEAELNSTFFKKQNCIPNMGTHYYYNMTRKMDCEEMLLWFALITDSELVGTGFQTIGKLNKKNLKDRNWFETVPGARRATELAIPHAPDCLRDWTEKYGVISMHIYYTNKPWEIRCKSGDSIKPGPPLDRLILNGLRYANQISDEVQKLFSG